ncbi:hypothetical protein [Ekhidna sp.]|uniref:hypothetical protein n=1 Tax=Ekhidna sp. TaxID=2608089 RepID=UPI003CCBD1F1
MKDENDDILGTFFGVLIGALGLVAIMSLFEDDSSKIVSKKGRNVLSDKKRMKDINEKIQASESQNQYNEILIN